MTEQNEEFSLKKTPKFPEINAQAAIVVSQADGKILLEKNSCKRLYPAFATKILASIIALEKCKPDDVVTISSYVIDEIAKYKGSANIKLAEGEQITIRELLYAMLLVSANDAMFALAEHIAGNINAFSVMMDQTALALGAKNTNIADENGMFTTEQFSTAVDLAIISRRAMFNKDFRKIVKTESHKIPPTNMHKERNLFNTNHLVSRHKTKKYYYKTAIGIKSGFTPRSKHCLAASALPPVGIFGEEILVIILGAENTDTYYHSFADAITLFEYTFRNYSKLSGKKPHATKEKPKGLFTVSEICRALNVTKCTAKDMYISAVKKGADNIVKDCAYISTGDDQLARNAVAQGAAVIICGKLIPDLPCIVVSYLDTATELLANFIKTKTGLTAIGVLDCPQRINPLEMINLAVCEKHKTVKCTNIDSNKSAVMRTLFSVDTDTTAAVLKVGLLDEGNVAAVGRIANFDIAVIISTSASRNDNNLSKQEVLQEKLEIFENMSETGTVVINIDDPMLAGVFSIPQDVITIGVDNNVADYVAENIMIDGDKIEFDVVHKDEITSVEVLSNERHVVYQVLAAFAVGGVMGISNQKIKTGVERYKPSNGLNVYKIGTNIVMSEFENNGADTVINAIKTICETKPIGKGRRLAVFGDLMQKGTPAITFHKKIGELINRSNIDLCVCFGESAKYISSTVDITSHNVIVLNTTNSLVELLKLNIRPDDVILFKGMEETGLPAVIKAVF